MVYTLSEKRQLLSVKLKEIRFSCDDNSPWARMNAITAFAYERQIKTIDRLIEAFPNA